VDVLHKLMNKSLPSITILPLSVVSEVNAVIQKATATVPKLRFASLIREQMDRIQKQHSPGAASIFINTPL
jgi:hypothetical protein